MDASTEQVLFSHLASILPPLPEEDFRQHIRQEVARRFDAVIVLDDDPTGTQTVHSLPVLTSWEESVIEAEFRQGSQCFYISTNTRSLPKAGVEELIFSLCTSIRKVSEKLGRTCLVISRGDSTLRGHYPYELIRQEEGLGQKGEMHILIPAFFEGGRYTVGDIHYVREEDRLIPVADTPFAKDSSFGYEHAKLQEWVEEKTFGEIAAQEVISISIPQIRGEIDTLIKQIKQIPEGSTVIVNAVSYGDLSRFIWAYLCSERTASFRTAASFVSAFLTLDPKALLTQEELISPSHSGGLIVVGSHVPKSTLQLAYLCKNSPIQQIEISVSNLLGEENPMGTLSGLVKKLNESLSSGQDVVLYTSRMLVEGRSKEESLEIGKKVSAWLVSVVKSLAIRPAFLVAKGGITSSDTASQALNVHRAWVMGQVLPGVPVWKLGPESKYPGISYIIFPGNVGQEDSLHKLLTLLSGQSLAPKQTPHEEE